MSGERNSQIQNPEMNMKGFKKIEEFNEKVAEIKEKISIDFSNVVEAEEEYTSGHACWNSHSLCQYCKLEDGTEIELVIEGDNGYYPGVSWISASLKVNGEEIASVKLKDEETEDVTEDDFILLWEKEPYLSDDGWKLDYWQTDSVNYGSYKCHFIPGRSSFVAELEDLSTDEFPGEGEIVIEVPREKVTEELLEKARQFKVGFEDNKESYYFYV